MRIKGKNAHRLLAITKRECSLCDVTIEKGKEYIFCRKNTDEIFRVCLSCLVDLYCDTDEKEIEKLKINRTANKI